MSSPETYFWEKRMMQTKTELWAGPLDGLRVEIPPGIWSEEEEAKILVTHHVYVFCYETARFEYGWSV